MRPFAQLLLAHIKRRGITNAQLAKKIKVPTDMLLSWLNEHHFPYHRDEVLRCATHLNLSLEECNELLSAANFPPEDFEADFEAELLQNIPAVFTPPAITGLPFTLTAWHRSPFVVGPPITEPRQFFGREYIIKRIFDVWKYMPLQHIAIVGLKRSGKTSLLHYLSKIIDTPPEKLRPGQRNDWLVPGYQWVFVDFQDPRMCYQESLLRHLLMELNMPIPEPCDLVNFMEILDQYLEIPVFFLLDEINVGLKAPELNEQFWWGMRSLGSNHAGGKIGFLLTAQESPEEMLMDDNKPSPFFNIFGHVLNLGPLVEHEAQKLINSSPLPFASNDIEWILEQSGYWPAIIQMLCHSLLTALEEGRNDDSWRTEGLRRMSPYRYLLEATKS